MYRDTEQSYGDYTLDVYQTVDGLWVCDWWKRSEPEICGNVRTNKRKAAIAAAKIAIDGTAKRSDESCPN